MTVHDGYDAADVSRWVAEDPARKQADRDDFARDRARVVHSAALRRLGAKTQVVQPDSDDFVRNRLTHSLEVAQIGREFGAALGCNADVVDTACLAHDLGHPPFGHNGERALAELAADIGGFEGNAQTLRLLTRLEAKRTHADGRPAGLNLTRASLDATMKYPWRAGELPGVAKFGVYESDAEAFAWAREGAPQYRRCLEAQVMDWSDDVGYCVHDLEDGVASGRIGLEALRSQTDMAAIAAVARRWYAADMDVEELLEAWGRVLQTGAVPQSYAGSRSDLAALKDMTSWLIGRFVSVVVHATRERHGDGVLSRYRADLVVPDSVRAETAMLKAVAAHYVMFTGEREQILADQTQAVRDLVAAFESDVSRMDPVHRQDFDAAVDAGDDAGARRAIIDQVASLSDARALVLHRRWAG